MSKAVRLKDLYLEIEKMKKASDKNGVYIPHERYAQDEAEKKARIEKIDQLENDLNLSEKVDICCFDKTGTLTSDDMEFSGVGLPGNIELEADMTKVPARTLEILASCHALVFVDKKLVY